MEELLSAIGHLKDSSTDADGIPYSLIVNASFFFLTITNNIFLFGTPPEDWKTQIVVPILKPGQLFNNSSGYRPIALSSDLAKILEHLIK